MTMTARTVVLVCMTPLLGVAAAACSRASARDMDAARPEVPTVAAAQVAQGDIAQTLTVTAEFRPYQEIELHAKVAGYVKTINVDVGDRVRAGQLLATLEVPEMEDQLKTDDVAIRRA